MLINASISTILIRTAEGFNSYIAVATIRFSDK